MTTMTPHAGHTARANPLAPYAGLRIRLVNPDAARMLLGGQSADDPATAYAAERNRLWLAATAAIAAAGQLTHPITGPLDLAAFVGEVLTAVDAHTGEVGGLLAGRTPTTDADTGERVTVRLNVASLVDLHAAPGNGPYVDALDALDLAYDHALTAADRERLDLAAGELHRDWTDRYTAYADRFTAAVHAAADRLSVTVPVAVETSTDPDNVYGDPDNSSQPTTPDRAGELLAWQLWRTALDTHPINELIGPLNDRPAAPRGRYR